MNKKTLLATSVSAIASLSLITGCAQIGATLPSMERVVHIAKESAKEPATWIPFTAAAVIGITGTDDNISDWAADHTPIFGSQSNASDASDNIRNALVLGMAVSSIAAPVPIDDSTLRARRIAANALSFATTTGIVAIGKRTIKRDRPNNRDDKSFPSGHSSGAFTSAILIEHNLNASIEKPWLRKTIKVGTQTAAVATAWARVEAEEHHPVDVLFSAALSNFVVKTFYRSIVTDSQSLVPPIAIETSRKGFMVRLNHSF